MDTLNQDLSRLVQKFRDDLIAEVKRAVLAQATTSLRWQADEPPARPRSRRSTGSRSVTPTRDKLREQLLQAITTKPGLRAEQLRAEVGGNANSVRSELHRLRAAKLVIARGKARGTTYRLGAKA